ncbi:MAG TPA: helix-turn-helix transcriptional regulator [Micromonosporaceae bacterium]
MTPRPDRHPIVLALKGRRIALGLSQREVAAAAGTWQGRLTAWETGHAVPTLDSLTAWAAALGCELVLAETDREETR